MHFFALRDIFFATQVCVQHRRIVAIGTLPTAGVCRAPTADIIGKATDYQLKRGSVDLTVPCFKYLRFDMIPAADLVSASP